MQPASAEAAATAGLARTTSLFVCPMRPTKFRLVVATARSPAAMTPICPPRQGPQVGVETAQPEGKSEEELIRMIFDPDASEVKS